MKVNKVALCLIARLENKYIREYIEHYINLGFDKIFIYDNNRPGEERIIDEVNDFAESGFVDVIDWPDFTHRAQKTSYQDCWDKNHNSYDWIAFFDADEYLILNNASNIKEFLSNEIYDGYYVITVSIKNYDDNDIIVNDSKTRLDKYTRESENQVDIWVKSIVRCDGNNVDFMIYEYDINICPYHIPKIENQKLICNVDGETGKTSSGIWSCGDGKNAFLKHIPTGCIDDFVKYKDVRKHIHGHDLIGICYFFLHNKETREKRDYFYKNRISKV